eukprot:3521935-Pyramimonas_sp.AAC.3
MHKTQTYTAYAYLIDCFKRHLYSNYAMEVRAWDEEWTCGFLQHDRTGHEDVELASRPFPSGGTIP